MKKFKLGPIQRAWIKDLREHPERQMPGALGEIGEDGTISACCLGQAAITRCRLLGLPEPFNKEGIIMSEGSEQILYNYDDFGLLSESGSIKGEYRQHFNNNYTLASCNDHGMTWAEIADQIDKYPEAVFNKSV